MNIFENAAFLDTVNRLKDLPDAAREIAFVGRSNAGKSSCINCLTRQKRLAFVSKTPGRTQFINFFALPNGLRLVDLPGYGFAEVPEKIRMRWVGFLGDYIMHRPSLMGLFVIMDCRRPFTPLDLRMFEFAAARPKPARIHLVLTKADKLSRSEQAKALAHARRVADGYDLAFPATAQIFSSLKKIGVETANEVVASWFPELFGEGAADSADAGLFSSFAKAPAPNMADDGGPIQRVSLAAEGNGAQDAGGLGADFAELPAAAASAKAAAGDSVSPGEAVCASQERPDGRIEESVGLGAPGAQANRPHPGAGGNETARKSGAGRGKAVKAGGAPKAAKAAKADQPARESRSVGKDGGGNKGPDRRGRGEAAKISPQRKARGNAGRGGATRPKRGRGGAPGSGQARKSRP